MTNEEQHHIIDILRSILTEYSLMITVMQKQISRRHNGYLLLSNGKLPGNPVWLSYALPRIKEMIVRKNIKSAVLVPYAVLRGSHDERAEQLSDALGIKVTSIEHFSSPVEAIEQAECILVSGGNTWWLNKCLHENGLIVAIQRAVRERGVPYIGWSAGCNVATQVSVLRMICLLVMLQLCHLWGYFITN